jgi:hypothetical protein
MIHSMSKLASAPAVAEAGTFPMTSLTLFLATRYSVANIAKSEAK